MILKFIGKTYRYLRKRYNTFENVFQITGGVVGLIVSIILLASGIAAIPFTGGASLLPVWVGAMIFVGIVTTTFLAAGRMIGITIDTAIDLVRGDKKLTNEKLATAFACVAGIVLASLAFPLNFFAIPFISAAAMIPLWQGFMIFLPATISTIASVGRHIGRTVDRHVRQKGSLYDVCKKMSEYFRGDVPEPQIVFDANNITRGIGMATRGIDRYLDPDNVQHYGYLARLGKRLDPDTGKNRATVYFRFLTHENITTDLQKAIILHTMLTSSEGKTLKEIVASEMEYAHPVLAVHDLDLYIRHHVPANARNFLKENITSKLGLFADNGKKFEKNHQVREGYQLILNNLSGDVRFKN